MTREQTKELLPVIQAFAEGAAIQCRPKQGQTTYDWKDGGDKMFFDPDLCEYRIKPELVDRWAIVHEKRIIWDTDRSQAYAEEALKSLHSCYPAEKYRIAHLREVTE